MGIDRDSAEEPDPRHGSSPSSADAPDPSRSDGPDGSSRPDGSGTSGAPSSGSAAEYGYGAPQPAGAGDGRAAGADAEQAGLAGGGEVGSGNGSAGDPGGPGSSGGTDDTDPSTGMHPTTGLHPETGLRPGTAPRAVLRPVPEGFPTPPPRPSRPNRRPAPPVEPETVSRRGPAVIASLAVVAVLILVVAVGGSILAYRALSPGSSDGAAPAATADGGDSSAGEVVFGEVTVREVSTEPGVQAVGDAGAGSIEAEGEFVVVTLEVDNGTDATVSIDGHEKLRTADGEAHETNSDASRTYIGEGRAYGTVAPGENATFHLVYDVPIGSEPVEVALDFAENESAGDGVLPLGG